MFTRLDLSIARLTDFVDKFIPAEMAADREMRKQARMFLFSHLFGPFVGSVVPLAIYILDPEPTYDVLVLAVAIVAFWIFPFALRKLGLYNLMVLLSVQNLHFCIFWSVYFYGGVHSPTLPWVLIIPLLSFFYIGPASSLRIPLFVQFMLSVAVLAAAVNIFDYAGAKDLPQAALQGLGLVSTFATAVYVTMMALYYAKMMASGVELEYEMKQHLKTAAELHNATIVSERAAKAKSEFLARMSHEIRTPLYSVIGYSELLHAYAVKNGNEQMIKDLGKIHHAGQSLLRLIEKILYFSKIEANKMELYFETIDVTSVLERAVAKYRALAEQNGNKVVMEVAPGVDPVTCDVEMLQKVLNELLENAAVFTQCGRITVSAGREAGPSGEDISIKVRDTGSGIAPDKMARLFEKFTVAADFSSSKYGGTGLGLALAQQLCRLMGGDISVESELGAGSCFTITLPAKPQELDSSGPTPIEPAEKVPPIQPSLPERVSYSA